MPTINKKKNNHPSSSNYAKIQLRKKLYQNTTYRRIRDWYMMEHPLCEECLKEDKLTPSCDCHHKMSPFVDGLSYEERIRRLCDENNFLSLCRQHHEEAHGNVKKEK